MESRVQKWGNSLALRLPKALAAEAHLEADSLVRITVTDGRVVISPVRDKLTLEELLAKVTPENRHGEIQTGGAVGLEHW